MTARIIRLLYGTCLISSWRSTMHLVPTGLLLLTCNCLSDIKRDTLSSVPLERECDWGERQSHIKSEPGTKTSGTTASAVYPMILSLPGTLLLILYALCRNTCSRPKIQAERMRRIRFAWPVFQSTFLRRFHVITSKTKGSDTNHTTKGLGLLPWPKRLVWQTWKSPHRSCLNLLLPHQKWLKISPLRLQDLKPPVPNQRSRSSFSRKMQSMRMGLPPRQRAMSPIPIFPTSTAAG
jgi:hypothetical protein